MEYALLLPSASADGWGDPPPFFRDFSPGPKEKGLKPHCRKRHSYRRLKPTATKRKQLESRRQRKENNLEADGNENENNLETDGNETENNLETDGNETEDHP